MAVVKSLHYINKYFWSIPLQFIVVRWMHSSS